MIKQFIAAIAASFLLISTAFAADIDGEWDMMLSAAEGATTVTMDIKVDGDKVTATSGSEKFTGTYKDGELKLKGDLYVPEAGMAAPLDMTVKLEGEKFKGSATWDMYLADVTGTRR